MAVTRRTTTLGAPILQDIYSFLGRYEQNMLLGAHLMSMRLPQSRCCRFGTAGH